MLRLLPDIHAYSMCVYWPRGTCEYLGLGDGVGGLCVTPGARMWRAGVAAAAVLVCWCFLPGCSPSCAGWLHLLLVHRISFDCFISIHLTRYFVDQPFGSRHSYGVYAVEMSTSILGIYGHVLSVSPPWRCSSSKTCSYVHAYIRG